MANPDRMNGITSDLIDGFIYGACAGFLIGCALGATGMYCLHVVGINDYTLRILKEMRADWDR